MPTRTSDVKCYRLALDFLDNVKPELSFGMWEHHADILASDIQRLIDNYIEGLAGQQKEKDNAVER